LLDTKIREEGVFVGALASEYNIV